MEKKSAKSRWTIFSRPAPTQVKTKTPNMTFNKRAEKKCTLPKENNVTTSGGRVIGPKKNVKGTLETGKPKEPNIKIGK